MKTLTKEFLTKDFEKVRDFLQDTYSRNSSNWYIERWSWSRFVNCYWLEVFDTWPSTVGMWVDESDEIVAVVSSEGEKNGDVFFQLKNIDYDEGFINEMINFAEEKLSVMSDGKKHMYPRINNICKELFTKVLNDRDYSYTGKNETDSSIEIDEKLTVILPIGFSIEPANKYSANVRALAHGRAFSKELSRIEALMNERTRAYTGLVKSPDYNEYLDLCVVDDSGTIAAFATLWFDSKNLIGALEPLGTISKYRRNGLGKALVYEGINRLRELGANKLHVGSSQLFYKKIGFNIESETEIWQRVII